MTQSRITWGVFSRTRCRVLAGARKPTDGLIWDEPKNLLVQIMSSLVDSFVRSQHTIRCCNSKLISHDLQYIPTCNNVAIAWATQLIQRIFLISGNSYVEGIAEAVTSNFTVLMMGFSLIIFYFSFAMGRFNWIEQRVNNRNLFDVLSSPQLLISIRTSDI